MTHWYYIDGPKRVGPFGEREWQDLIDSGTIRPETLVWNEDLPGWVPYRALLSDGASGPEGMPPIPSAGSFAAMRAEQEAIGAYERTILEEDYSLSFRETLWDIWQVFNRHVFKLLGYFILVGLVFIMVAMVPFLGALAQLALGGVAAAALYNVVLRCFDGKPTSVSDLAIGFDGRYIKDLIIQGLIKAGVVWGVIIVLVVASIFAGLVATGGEFPNFAKDGFLNGLPALDPTVIAVYALLYLIIISVAIFFQCVWFFSVPLIIDKNLPWKSALRVSYHKVMQHPWKFGWVLTLVYFALSIPCFIAMVVLAFAMAILSGLDEKVPAFAAFVPLIMLLFMFGLVPMFFIACASMYRKIFTLKRDRPVESPIHE